MTSHRGSIIALLAVVALAGCSDAGPLAPDEAAVAAARGGNGKGGGNGGGGDGGGGDSAPVVDELDPWDASVWVPQHHALGRGLLDASNVSQGAAGVLLALPPGTYDGAEIRSAERHRHRTIEARLRTPDASGSISAFFFYEGDPRRNDEIDIEIFNDGSRRVWFTTWVDGRQTNHAEAILPFDPGAGFHDYRIEWSRSRVAFSIDGTVVEEFASGVPRDAMYIYANAWWPVWLDGPVPAAGGALEIDRIVY